MKFVLIRSFLPDACLQKSFKFLKIKRGQVTLPKTGLMTPCTFSPLEVNPYTSYFETMESTFPLTHQFPALYLGTNPNL
jgi:hypothetical protein